MVYTLAIITITVALSLVEATAVSKLTEWLSWTYGKEEFIGIETKYLAAVAFITLMVSSLLARATNYLSEDIKKEIEKAGNYLIFTQAIANIVVAYHYTVNNIPADSWTTFTIGLIDKDTAARMTAIHSGAILSLVSISFWKILARLISTRSQMEQEKHTLSASDRKTLEEMQQKYGGHVPI